MSDMTERVARAICKAHYIYDDYNEEEAQRAADNEWVDWCVEARAAIEAMREPTGEMLLAAWGSEDDQGEPGVTESTWTAMIDAALKDV